MPGRLTSNRSPARAIPATRVNCGRSPFRFVRSMEAMNSSHSTDLRSGPEPDVSERAAGYAIAEMLASLVIVGMIAALMISGVTTGRRVWERMDASNAAAESVAGAQLMLRERIARIFPATLNDTMPPYADFDGTADHISFLGEARDSQRPTALRRYRLALDTDGDLVLTSVNDTAADQSAANEALVLLR